MTDPASLRFSLVVPAYNEEAYLADTLRSLCHQDFRGPYEIVVVDNHSTDATADIARSFDVRVVEEPAPGVCQARQRGLDEATGEIVVSVDADTCYPPGWLARVEESFRGAPDVIAVAGPCRYRDAPWWMTGFSSALFGLVGRIYRMTGWVGYISATNTAFVRSAFDSYDLTLSQGGDELDLLRRLRRRGRVVWDAGNVVETSPRRQTSGLLQSVFVSFLVYYLLAYALNRITKRAVLGRAPVFRTEGRHRRVRWGVGVALAALLAATLGVARYLSGTP